MNPVRIKICGITRPEDAAAAVRLGADALGFNFFPGSKRYCPPETARRIVSGLPPFVTAVAVFVDAPLREMVVAMDVAGIRVAQLHGDEAPELCAQLPGPVIKALRVQGAGSLQHAGAFPVAAVLLDAATPQFGGSGVRFDWSLAVELAAARPVIVAGGLDASNVAEAIRTVRPYAVDVASGVERMPGVKDPERMRQFIEAVKEASR